MRLLIDTDAFCKLACGGVLQASVNVLGADFTECGRLPALPYMLRRGRLRRVFGPEACDAMIPIAEQMPVAAQPSELWLGKLTPVQDIDPGEAQILAAAAEAGLFVMSGDKRALRAIRNVDGFSYALGGRVVVLEAILLALCDRFGSDDIRQRLRGSSGLDKVVSVCFSAHSQSPPDALLSYYRSLAAELVPLVLWNPRPEGGA